MQITTYYFVALIVGLVAGVYLPLNGRFGEQIGSPLLATAVFFSIGAVTAVTVYLIIGDGVLWGRLKQADLPLYALGVVSFGIILAATYFIPRIGPGAYFICLVAGQTIAGLTLNHFGLLAPERLPLTPLKLIGAIAVIAGVILIWVVERQQFAGSIQQAPKSHEPPAVETNQ